MPTHIDREAFLRNLCQSGLLSDQEIREALPSLPPPTASSFAAWAAVAFMAMQCRQGAGLEFAANFVESIGR